MASSTLSDPYIAAAFWTGLGALLLTLLLALQILRLRILLRRSERQESQALVKWRPVLNAAALGESPAALPLLLRAEQMPLMKLWIHLQTSMRGDAQLALNDIACRLGLDATARSMLTRGRRGENLLSTLVLGYLRDKQAWPQLLRLAGRDDSALSLNALWALVRIDPQAAAEVMTPFFIRQQEWPLTRVIGILQEARDQVATVLNEILPGIDAAHLPRGLHLAEALRLHLPAEILTAALRSTDVPVAVAALRSVFTADTIVDVRTLLTHPEWQVRVQAAKALGRIGDHSDIARLAPLLQDAQWWVRYRAARSLLELPAVSMQELENLRAGLADRFAADMLAQAMAEKGMA